MLRLEANQAVNLTILGIATFVNAPSPALAQSPLTSVAMDPFIRAVETIKRSVSPVDCMAVHGAEAKILQRAGSAFFISKSGDFMTAAHVIRGMRKGDKPCPTSALTLPVDSWHPESRDETFAWFPFDTSECRIDDDSDLAVCRLNQDLLGPKLTSMLSPVTFEWNVPPDGTQVAFTGFPMYARDPMTVRSAVSAYRIQWQSEKPGPELLLDRPAWPGYSGSPVYLSDGTVIAILVAGGKDDATGITLARPASLIRKFLSEEQKK